MKTINVEDINESTEFSFTEKTVFKKSGRDVAVMLPYSEYHEKLQMIEDLKDKRTMTNNKESKS